MVDGSKRVYYDSNMWVAYMRGRKDMFYGACSPFFDRAEQGLDFVVVSHLVMAETIHALRRIATNEFRPTSSVAADHASMQFGYRTDGEQFIGYVEHLVRNGNAGITNFPNTLFDHHYRIFSKISDYAGRITGGNGSKYRYAGLGHADIEHAYLALYSGASEFCSTDKAFGQLCDDPAFAGISFNVLS